MATIPSPRAKDSLGRFGHDIVTAFFPTNVTFQYDANGNLTNDGLRSFVYDDEKQLTSVSVAGSFKSEFTYDSKMRRASAGNMRGGCVANERLSALRLWTETW